MVRCVVSLEKYFLALRSAGPRPAPPATIACTAPPSLSAVAASPCPDAGAPSTVVNSAAMTDSPSPATPGQPLLPSPLPIPGHASAPPAMSPLLSTSLPTTASAPPVACASAAPLSSLANGHPGTGLDLVLADDDGALDLTEEQIPVHVNSSANGPHVGAASVPNAAVSDAAVVQTPSTAISGVMAATAQSAASLNATASVTPPPPGASSASCTAQTCARVCPSVGVGDVCTGTSNVTLAGSSTKSGNGDERAACGSACADMDAWEAYTTVAARWRASIDEHTEGTRNYAWLLPETCDITEMPWEAALYGKMSVAPEGGRSMGGKGRRSGDE